MCEAMTEPAVASSDATNIRTDFVLPLGAAGPTLHTCVQRRTMIMRDGDHWVINGAMLRIPPPSLKLLTLHPIHLV